MADYIVKDTELTSVANAIRTAGGTNSLLNFPNGFVSAVNNISGDSSDFSTAKVTLVNNKNANVTLYIPNADDLEGTSFSPASLADAYVVTNSSIDITAILYKGQTIMPYSPNLTVTGNASIDMGQIFITGDCTITIS